VTLAVIDTPTRRELPRRPGKPIAVVIHGTGQTDLDKCIAWYTNPQGLQPHYMIAATGTVRRFVAEDHVAYHAALVKEEIALYRQGWQEWSTWAWRLGGPVHTGQEFGGYRSWRDQWQSKASSPLDLATGERPNLTSIGIEVQSLAKPTPRVFNDEQYAALAELLFDVCRRNSIPLMRERVLGHFDVSPMRRANERGSFDPGERFDWNRLWDAIGRT
jgi:N-acetyl-anhydromuramyl-L-alanine amidase AmpD